VQIGAGEAEKLVTGDAGARAKIEAELKGAGQRAAGFTGDDLLKQGTVGGGLQRQAGLSNQRIGSGQNMLKMVQDFEEAQGAATKSVSALVGQFDELSGTIAKISESLPQDASTWQAFGDAVRQITLGH
jgi:chromosome segregation ATPase